MWDFRNYLAETLSFYEPHQSTGFLAYFRVSPSTPIFGSVWFNIMGHCEDWWEGRRSEAVCETVSNLRDHRHFPQKMSILSGRDFFLSWKFLEPREYLKQGEVKVYWLERLFVFLSTLLFIIVINCFLHLSNSFVACVTLVKLYFQHLYL